MLRALLALTWGLLVGCSADEDPRLAHTAEGSAFTVEGGDRFVVSASADHIVLDRHVGGITFPFDRDQLLGKAILIHPVNGRATDGVYSRATEVTVIGDHFDVRATPLTLQEMATIGEDDIVRIYVPNALRVLAEPTSGVSTSRSLGIDGLDFNGFLGITHPTKIGLGMTVKSQVDQASFVPEVLFGYSKERGLELGARASLSWLSKLTISGTVNEEFFHSPSLDAPPLRVVVWIGVVPVPLTIKASAYISCLAGLAGPIETDLRIAAEAQIGGSVRIDPSAEDLIRTGSWEPVATGSGGVTEEAVRPRLDGSIACALPRVDIKALVAGVAGPVISIVPNATLDDTGPGFEIALYAGFARADSALPASVKLVSYKP